MHYLFNIKNNFIKIIYAFIMNMLVSIKIVFVIEKAKLMNENRKDVLTMY